MSIWKSSWFLPVLGFVLLLLLSPLRAASQISPLAETTEKLRAIQEDQNDPAGVPERVQALLKQLKSEIREFLTESLSQGAAWGASNAGDLRGLLLAELRKKGVELRRQDEEEPGKGFFGNIEEIKVDVPDYLPDKMAITVTLQIPYGSDSSFYVFQKTGYAWRLIIVKEANDYSDIGGGLEGFDHQFSPPTSEGNWFVVVGNTHPWPSSCWNAITYSVLAPGPDPDKPSVLFHKENGIYRCEDELFKLHTTSDSFRVSYFSDGQLDFNSLMIRVHNDAFQFVNGSFERVSAQEETPAEFVDEWAYVSWADASLWSDPNQLETLQHWHETLEGKKDQTYTSEFTFAQACGDSGKNQRWQVGLEITSENHTDYLPENLFFEVTRLDGKLTLTRIDTKRPPGCPGETPIESPSSPRKLP
jgi:hypothetical protein